MKSWNAVTDVNGASGRRVWKAFLTKEEQIQQHFFFLNKPSITETRKKTKQTKMYILVVFKNKIFVILLLILT